MSLRHESIRAYRELYSAAAHSAQECGLHNALGLLQYVSKRYGQETELHHRQLSHTLRTLERRSENDKAHGRQRRPSTDQTRSKLLRQYQKHISSEIDRTRAFAHALLQAPGNAALTSVLQVLSAGVGNAAYQQIMEVHFLSFLEYESKRASRDETAEDATSERQNRIMQQALLPYAERLLLVHRTAIGEQNRESPLVYMTPWQVTEAIAGNRGGVTAVHLRVGRDHLVVEVDETYNKQVVYVCCTRREGSDSGSYEWAQDIERVEISESEEVQRTMFHSEYLFTATRICDTLVHDSPLHPTRSTVIVGHAVGGAVGLVLSLLLSQRGFEITNTISLGAPKVLQGTLERFVTAVNAVRVVLAGDPLVELPVTGAEGAPFVHIGEILLLTPSGSTDDKDAMPLSEQVATSQPSSIHSDGNDDNNAGLTAPPVPERDTYTAESLSAMLGDSEGVTDEHAVSTDKAPSSPSSAESLRDTGISSEGDVDDEDAAELLRVARERYKEHFLVEDYVRYMQSPSVDLTYAEGDEVWDDGDYETMRRTGKQEPIVTAEERRVRDLRGPL